MTFADLTGFIAEEARLLCHPVTSVSAVKGAEKKSAQMNTYVKKSARVLQSTSRPSGDKNMDKKVDKFVLKTEKKFTSNKCLAYKSLMHDLESCSKFQEKNLKERKDFMRRNWLCFACLQPKHQAKDCK